MQNQEVGGKTEVGIIDALDHATRLRGAIGYLADNTKDQQLCSLLMTIEESAEMLESLLQYLCEMGIEEEREKGVAEDIPFD